MAQTIKLKRSATSGAVPTTSQLELGEVAINTNDGKMYFEKDNGTPSIREVVTADQSSGDVDLSGNLSLGDSKEVRLGASDDLKLYHDGSHSYISDSGTGRLNVKTNVFRIYNAAGDEISANFVQDGAVSLYHNGSVKLQTTSTGIDVTGDVSLGDNGKAKFGASDDLQIYHDGSHSYISEEGTGNLYLKTDGLGFKFQAGWLGTMYDAVDILAIGTTIQYLGSPKFTVGSTGAEVFGDLVLSDTTADSAAGPELTFERNSASPADADYLGQLKFQGKNDAAQDVLYAKVTGKISDASDGTEDGLLETAVKKAGSNVIVSRQTGDALKLINGSALEVDSTITSQSRSVGTQSIVSTAPTSATGFPDGHVWYVV